MLGAPPLCGWIGEFVRAQQAIRATYPCGRRRASLQELGHADALLRHYASEERAKTPVPHEDRPAPSFPAQRFDIVVSSDVLERIRHSHAAFVDAELFRVPKPGARKSLYGAIAGAVVGSHVLAGREHRTEGHLYSDRIRESI